MNVKFEMPGDINIIADNDSEGVFRAYILSAIDISDTFYTLISGYKII